ncbi:MAG: right-handed parallel beta-helix repeat-containing protein [Bacteroidota bacterium]
MNHRIVLFFALFVGFVLTSCTKDTLVSTDDLAEREALREIELAEEQVAAEIAEHLSVFAGKSRTEIPAGSRNALAGAIAAARPGAVIRLAAGDHFQDGTLTISKPINIIGAPGARLLLAGTSPYPTEAAFLVPAIHVLKTEFVRIRNLELVPVGGEGGTAILVQNAPYTFVSRVTANDWQAGVVIEQSEKVYVERSTFTGSSQWQTIPGFPVYGVVVVNGPQATIHNNDFANHVFAVWACDKRGRLSFNRFGGNFNGIELCKVPVAFPLPDGQVVGSEFPATRWLVYHNQSNDNFNNGFEVIDGANNCLLVNNTATGNGALDYEFAGVTERYGFVAPTSSRNRAFLKGGSRWADCGERNFVRRGEEVNDWVCF